MRTTSRRGASRLALAFAIGVGTLGGAAVVSAPALAAPVAPGPAYVNRLLTRLAGSTSAPEAKAAPARASIAAATTCLDMSTPPVSVTCPTITRVTVGSKWIRSSKTSITYPVSVVVNDPSGIATAAVTAMGRQLDRDVPTAGAALVGLGVSGPPVLGPGATKTFTMTVESPYLALFADPAVAPAPAYGGFQINTVVLGDNPDLPPLVQIWRSGSITARSAVTNTPSASVVSKGQLFTERGKLMRFDSTPQGGQKVNVYYVPAGQTRASYAGTATTWSTGAWSLPVRSWHTGSWFVSYPGSVFSTSVYKGVWVRVS